MKFANQITTALIASLLLPLTASATESWSYVQAKYATGEATIHSACMMPVEGTLSKLGMKGREGMTSESETWSQNLQTVVEFHLKGVGLELSKAGDIGSSNGSDSELQQILNRLQQKYDGIHAQIEKKPKDIGKDRFTLGDEVSLLPCAAKSDVLVFVEGAGQLLTGGKTAFGLLVGGPSASTAHLSLSMVDAKTGEVIAFLRMNAAGNFANDSEKTYGSSLDKQLKKMKIGTPAPKQT